MGALAFWTVLGLVSLAIIGAAFFSRLEAERTIRQAIEKGLVSDGDTLRRLMQHRALSWPQRLIVLGLIFVFAALGGGVFAFSLQADEPDSTRVLLGIAGFVLLFGAGLMTAGFWLRLANRETP